MKDVREESRTLIFRLFGILWIYLTTDLLSAENATQHSQDKGGQFCDTETFRADCPEGRVILLTYARYGRMEIGRCVQLAMGYVGCQSDVLMLADRRCSGRRICDIRVPDAEFESTRPCLKELKTYLEIKYTCVPVETITTEYCKSNRDLNVGSSSGYIASIVTSDTPSCDGISHPWVISGHVGQRIVLTLYDFALEEPYVYQRLKSQELIEICRQYGVIQDSGKEKTTTLCGSDKRVSTLFRSTGHVIKVWVTAGSGPKDMKRFIVHYKVVGCRDLTMPQHLWFRRTATGNAIIGCVNSDVTWGILCENHAWSAINDTCPATDDVEGITSTFGQPIINGFAIVTAGTIGVIFVLMLTTLFIYRRLRKPPLATRASCLRQPILHGRKQECNANKDNASASPLVVPVSQRYPLYNLLPAAGSSRRLYHQHDETCRQKLANSSNEECEYVWQAPFPSLQESGRKKERDCSPAAIPADARTVRVNQYGTVSYLPREIYGPDGTDKDDSTASPQILSTL